MSRSRGSVPLATIVSCVIISVSLVLPSASSIRAASAADVAATPNGSFPTFDTRTQVASSAEWAALSRTADAAGRVSAILGLQVLVVPEGTLAATARSDQRRRIADARSALFGALAGTSYRTLRTYDTLPSVAIELSREAVAALQRWGRVASAHEDVAAKPSLADSGPIVEATEATALGFTGQGRTIAVIDSGVQADHPFLAGKVTHEYCYSKMGSCPTGGFAAAGPGAGAPCSFSATCAHGTHVAGIAAGSGVGFSGVAPGARLMAFNVASAMQFGCSASDGPPPCPLFFQSDWMAALDVLIVEKPKFPELAAVNLSFGRAIPAPEFCDALPANIAFSFLRSFGVAPVVSSGNDNLAGSIAYPGCSSSAISVGATDKADNVAAFSNSSPALSLLAPGVSITSSVTGGGFLSDSGTSMAAPHVSGAFAVMTQKVANFAVSSEAALAALRKSGKPLTDPKNNVTTPRLRLLNALVDAKPTGFKAAYNQALVYPKVTSAGVGLRNPPGLAGPTLAVVGIPSGASVKKAFLYWMTVGTPDPSVVFKGAPVTGKLVGASANLCTDVANKGAVRVYRADVTGAVAGNGNYAITGVGVAPGVAQGASLVVVSSDGHIPTPQWGRVVINHGALTAGPNSSMWHTLTGLSVQGVISDAQLHVGVADGDAATDGRMYLGSSPVTPLNAFSGSSGPKWDNLAKGVAASQLPGGTTQRTNRINTGEDCLSWAYSALYYRNGS